MMALKECVFPLSRPDDPSLVTSVLGNLGRVLYLYYKNIYIMT
ncbi:MAG: hypothetical protein J07HN4v3_02420 [Halonotius sp. J07HN4]|nr:MAG: hypothetical protein J07HN4v3_02420 [Halonotius sp. J07HN4]